MTDIPERVLEIWKTPLDIDTCEGLLDLYKLQCSTCDARFNNENQFAIHIETCLENAERNIHYQVHMHGNRLLMYTHRVALFCGASQQKEFLECGICKQSFENKETIRKHIRSCARYNSDYGSFIRKTTPLFSNMLFSFEKLGHLFQTYVEDKHIIGIRQQERQRRPVREITGGASMERHLFFDELSEHFIEKYQDYLFAVCGLIDDAFIRYLKKKELDSETEDIYYSIPTKRTRSEEPEEYDDEERRQREEAVVETPVLRRSSNRRKRKMCSCC
uniref:C2H2-type domain-containing protein n=1 Tax=Caenorhabditis tropicalis TaxID=1561998 RepID=A0A1I7TRM7_9PELO